VLPFVVPASRKLHGRRGEEAGQTREYDGQRVNMASLRLQAFARDGGKCVACGLQGAYFAVERHERDHSCHLNLYAVKDGVEVLMTKDHIHPRALGGKDHPDNLQTMCQPCNQAKGSQLASGEWWKEHPLVGLQEG